ncbi:MAG: hypothetical protein C0621_02115 [Desulfuromonas sp.]|nr:MAG: hypothetical protein C0621_02115 [Desulfuromonas sp.]
MFTTRLLVSIFELGLMIILSGIIISLIYRVFIKANPDFDMEEELARSNVAVGVLMASILVSSALLLHRGLEASMTMLRLAVTSPSEAALPLWQIALLMLTHFGLTLAISIVTISVTLRLFGKMARRRNPEMRLGRHLQQGNVAVGLLLAAAVFISTTYVGEGVSAVTKSLVPQPKIGKIRIMR